MDIVQAIENVKALIVSKDWEEAGFAIQDCREWILAGGFVPEPYTRKSLLSWLNIGVSVIRVNIKLTNFVDTVRG